MTNIMVTHLHIQYVMYMTVYIQVRSYKYDSIDNIDMIISNYNTIIWMIQFTN